MIIKKLLIIDDAAFMRRMIKDIVNKIGAVNTFEGQNGFEAIKLYRRIKPDLVILDLVMPDMDGLTALKEIRAIDPDACIVICSAMSQKSRIVEAIKYGAKDFIAKPFQEHRVLETVNKYLVQSDS